MKKHNILIINHYAGSDKMGMVFRTYYFAKEWVKLGHTVTILSADYSHLRLNNPVVKNDMDYEDIDGIRYYWIKTTKYKGNGIKRAKAFFEFCIKIFKYRNRIISVIRPDVIVITSVYHLDSYPEHYLTKKLNATYIHEVRDMWPITLVELGKMTKYHPFVQLIQMAENHAYKKADKLFLY